MIYVGSRHGVYLYCRARSLIFIHFFLHRKRPFPVELLPLRIMVEGWKDIKRQKKGRKRNVFLKNKYRRSASYLEAGQTGGYLKFKVDATCTRTATLNFHSSITVFLYSVSVHTNVAPHLLMFSWIILFFLLPPPFRPGSVLLACWERT